MNAREPFDLAKYAIVVLLLTLVLSATLSIFYTAFDQTDARIDSMQKATNSASMERLRDLRDISDAYSYNKNKLPLVTNIISALTEFNEEDLLYIEVISTSKDTGNTVRNVYTYTGVALVTDETYNATQRQDITPTVKHSDIPVTQACKDLLQYSDCRCTLVLGTYNDKLQEGQREQPSEDGEGLTFIRVIIEDKAYGGDV